MLVYRSVRLEGMEVFMSGGTSFSRSSFPRCVEGTDLER
jgi:hypothetical protein